MIGPGMAQHGGDAIPERKRDLAESRAASVGHHLCHVFRESARLTDEKKPGTAMSGPGFFVYDDQRLAVTAVCDLVAFSIFLVM